MKTPSRLLALAKICTVKQPAGWFKIIGVTLILGSPCPWLKATASNSEVPSYLTLQQHYSSETSLDVNPGFFANGQLVQDKSLQSCLDSELTKSGQIKKLDHSFSLVLVDLTGDKLLHPDLASYQPKTTMYGASQPKTAALLGAHQLLFDLQATADHLAKQGQPSIDQFWQEVKRHYAASAVDNWPTMFDVKDHGNSQGAGVSVSFTEAFKKEMDQMIRISNNQSASYVIKTLGFNYIHSVLWQLGFYRRSMGGGLWLGRTFAGGQLWHRDPIANQSHGTNALAMAKYMTLVAQGRLISPEISSSIKNFLANTIWPIKFVLGFQQMGLKVNEDHPEMKDPTKRVTYYRKSGSMQGIHNVSHDAGIVYRSVCLDHSCSQRLDLRYVVAGSSRDAATSYMPSFIQEMDRCILRQHQVDL